MKCAREVIEGLGTVIVCTDGRRAKCRCCGKAPQAVLCDGVSSGRGKTCDTPLCRDCAFQVGTEDLHLCHAHRPELHVPSDLLEANARWGASCGPGALAAALACTVMELREHFEKPWTTPTVMEQALIARRRMVRTSDGFPRTAKLALCFVQLHGTWDTAPVQAQYQRTHWVALRRIVFGVAPPAWFIFDVNIGGAGGWLLGGRWKSEVVPRLAAAHKGSSGRISFRRCIELVS